MNDKRDTLRALPWLFLVVILALALRLYNLGTESFWIDEANSLRDARVVTMARESKPLYYWMLSIWSGITSSEAGLRLLAVLFGVGGVVAIYLLGKSLFSRRAGLAAALLMAISPLHVNHSQEVRMYTLLTLCAVLSMLTLQLLLSRWTPGLALAYVAVSYATLLTHPLTVFLFVPQFIYILLHLREDRRNVLRIAVCMLLIAVLWLPWVPHVIKFGDNFTRTQTWAAEKERLSLPQLPLLWGQFMYGEYNRMSYPDKPMLRYGHLAYAFIVSAVATLAWLFGRKNRQIALAVMWLVIPLGLMMLLSSVIHTGWVPRYLIYTSPALFLLIGWILSRVPKRAFMPIIIMFLLLPALRLQRYYHNTLRPEWRQAVRLIESNGGDSDRVYIYKPCNRFIYTYYHKSKQRWSTPGDTLAKGEIVRFISYEPRRLANAARPSSKGRSWLIISGVGPGLTGEVLQEAGKMDGIKVNLHPFTDLDVLELTQTSGD